MNTLNGAFAKFGGTCRGRFIVPIADLSAPGLIHELPECTAKVERKYPLGKQNDHIVPIEEIETTHLRLRRPTTADTSILGDLWRNEQVRQFLGGVVSQEVIEGKIASLRQHWDEYGFGQWTISEKETGQIIGLCGLHHSEEGTEISYMFFPAFWRRGRATEAASASLNHGFHRLKFERIVAITQEANRGSCRLLERVGMHHINNLWRWNASQRVYELTQTEWLAREEHKERF